MVVPPTSPMLITRNLLYTGITRAKKLLVLVGASKALDYAILQKILPKINGYYDSYKTFFEKLTQICDENHLYMTKKAIDDIKNMQEQNMGYCQYLI